MRKLLLIFGIFSIICVIVSSVAESKINSANVTAETTAVSESINQDIYTVKSENGKVVVYRKDELYYKTDTATSTLPKADQRKLLYGISASTKDELENILQAYCS